MLKYKFISTLRPGLKERAVYFIAFLKNNTEHKALNK